MTGSPLATGTPLTPPCIPRADSAVHQIKGKGCFLLHLQVASARGGSMLHDNCLTPGPSLVL